MADVYPRFLADESDVPGEKNVSIISAPLAHTVSWGTGTDLGPAAILEASPALEVFDDELLFETVNFGIETLPPLKFDGMASEAALQSICKAVEYELQRKRLPVVLGGEHTVSIAAIAACARHYSDLCVIQVDAHLDLRDQYEEDFFSHACVMRRVADLELPFVQVGIRSFSQEEWLLVQHNKWQPFFMQRIKSEPDWLEQVCEMVSGRPVYITFDVDGLDPSIMPATGTPEPDGLSWETAIGFMRGIARYAKIVGLDFVEFAPYPGGHHAAFTVSKLIYRTLGYIYRSRWD